MRVRDCTNEEKGRSYEWRDRATTIPSRRSKKLLSARDGKERERERVDVVPGRRDRDQARGQKREESRDGELPSATMQGGRVWST